MKYFFHFLAYAFWGFALAFSFDADFNFSSSAVETVISLTIIGLICYNIPKWLNSSDSSNSDDEEVVCISIDGKDIGSKAGEYDDNITDGIRTLLYSDGSIYEGDIVNGLRDGKGTFNDLGNFKYVGEWKKGKMEGYGKITYEESETISYEGNFSDDNYDGFGTCLFKDGSIYEGNFIKNERNGKGKYTWKDGAIYDGEWYDGARHGMGIETYPDKSYWKGEYIKNEQFKGKWYYPEKKKVKRNPEKRVPHEVPEDRHRIINEDAEWNGNGSGVFISKNGYLVTNNHVIQDASKVSAEFIYNNEIEIFKVKVIRVDEANDLAILKVDDKKFKGFKSLPYSIKKSTCDVGTEVYALGYPMALSLLGKDLKFTDGKISAKSGFQGDIRQYQTTVPIQGGNSGGPLFDINGNLVGINSSKIRQDVADNVSYAIKSDYLVTFINALPQKIPLPSSRVLNGKKQTEQIKKLSDFVPLIKIA